MASKALPLSLVAAFAATCALAVSPALAAVRLSSGQAKKAALAAVAQSSSYQQINSPFALKVRSCKLSGNHASCKLYRSASQPCGLSGGPKPGQMCSDTVAFRAWKVRVSVNSSGASTTIVAVSDVTGQFEPGG